MTLRRGGDEHVGAERVDELVRQVGLHVVPTSPAITLSPFHW